MPAEVKKSVKKEELVAAKEKKKVSANVSGGKTRVKEAKAKKEEPWDDKDEDEEPSPPSRKTSSKKTQTVKKEIKEEVKKTPVAANENGKKREKKVFDLPGQKRDPPEERDPLRIFYESLYEQVPNSEMAAFWMMECGLLPLEVAKKVFAKKQKKLSLPVKTVASVTKSATVKKNISSPAITLQKKVIIEPNTVSKTLKKRKAVDERSSEADDDDDFVPLANRKTANKKLIKA